MKANSEKTKQSKKATRRVLAGVLCGASVLSLVLSLVMPPISQAIANDAEAGAAEKTVMGDSSSEPTDVDNTVNGDTEKLNSGKTEGDETGSSNDDEQAQTEDQLEDELQVEDGSSSNDDAVMAAAEGGQTKTAANEIASANDLVGKLEAVEKNEIASFDLTKDVECGSKIQLDESGSNITLNLNGHKIKYTNKRDPLFNITGGATLTVEDLVKDSVKDSGQAEKQSAGSIPLNDKGQDLHKDNYGKKAVLTWDGNGIPTYLTYYVIESVANETGTTETLNTYGANIAGAIVACDGTNDLKLVNLYDNGHFNLESGTLTQKQGDHVGNLIYAENGSTVTMNGGYICGADTGDSGAGAGIRVSNHNGTRSTFKMTNGVIADNTASSGAGVFAEDYVNASGANNDNEFTKGHPTVEMTGGIITGNYTRDSVDGLGGGILASGGSVTVSGGYITNNKYAKYCRNDGWGCHGGAGLAANYGAKVTISDGQITGNYSEEAGGGVYVTDVKRNDQTSRSGMAWLNITGGIIASNVSYRSEGAGIRVGQMVDAMINGTEDNKVYITNNHCMSRFDWGGGGIFVQGNSNAGKEYTAGRLFVYNSYISSNTAGGYGGGVAVCPTGKTLVTNTNGTAIFGNLSAGDEHDGDDHPNHPNEPNKKHAYDSATNTGNDVSPHLSGGGANKIEDRAAYKSDKFRECGHADFFLAATGHTTPVAVVSGKMLGDIDAKYSGSIELTNRITIPANGAVGVKNSIGLTSDVKATDQAVTDAVQGKVKGTKVTTFITGNYSWDHGGGIMSNGDLYLGQPADAYAYPSLKLKATKELDGRDLKDGEFTFTVYRKDSDTAKAPSWDNNGNFSTGDCDFVKSAQNNADGNIAFDLSEKLSELLSKQFKASGTGETTDYDITYYMVENAGDELGVKYDHAVYEIKVKVKCTPTELMSVPIQGKPNETKKLMVYNFTIDNVCVTKNPGGSASSPRTASADANGYYSIVDSISATSTNKATFANKYDPEVSWTPEATKVVEGGEMKEFTLQLAKDSKFDNIIGTAVTSAGKNTKQTLSFKDTTDNNKTVELKYSLSDIRNNPDDSGGSTGGPFKTFTYYVREKTDGSQFSHYTYDHSVYRFTVEPTYDTKTGEINCRATYMKGSVDSKGDWTADPNAKEKTFIDTSAPNSADTSTPIFTNTYSTSLPLSGMSGVTLTYLAGAAVLCAAAAWMHIRRKANAKGGERRE